jgi:hypothetical protein
MEFNLFDNKLRKFHTLGINRKCFDFLINGCNIHYILEKDDVFKNTFLSLKICLGTLEMSKIINI